MGRLPCCEKVGLKKGPWTPEEDKKLLAYVKEHGFGNWRSLPAKAGLQRCGKSCRLRWINYLKPDIKRGKFSLEEDRNIIQLHALLGNKWSIIAGHLPKRTDNEIKNYWNTHLKKRLIRMGIDPITHKPIADNTIAKDATNLSHMAQWESARLEAEARESMSQVGSCSPFQPPPRLIISRIPAQPSQQQPLPCLDVLKAWQSSRLSESLSTSTENNNTMHNMCAIVLAMDYLVSPASTLSFPGTKLPISATVDQFTKSSASYVGDGDITETSNRIIMEGTGSSMQDDDIVVAAEAFRAQTPETIPELSNTAMECFNNDMLASDSYEIFADEYGNGNCNLEANFLYGNTAY